jgi:excisionase family DNA binding protein
MKPQSKSDSGRAADDLLTQEEAAAKLKVTVRTLVRLQNEGVVPFVLLGKSVRFYWPAVISHLTTNFTICRWQRHGQIPPMRMAAEPHGTSLRPSNQGGRP